MYNHLLLEYNAVATRKLSRGVWNEQVKMQDESKEVEGNWLVCIRPDHPSLDLFLCVVSCVFGCVALKLVSSRV